MPLLSPVSQHPGAQHGTVGFVARMNALRNLPSTCPAISSTAIPASVRNTRASSMSYVRVVSKPTSTKPAADQFRSIVGLFQCACDAAHPEQHALTDGGRNFAARHNVRDSETATGRSTRKASRRTRDLSAERLMTQLEMTTSTELSGSGMFSISPFRNSTLTAPACR